MRASACLVVLPFLLQACDAPSHRGAPSPERSDLPTIVETVAPLVLQQDLDKAMRDVEGPVGVSIISLDSGWRIDKGCNLHLPQQSVSKLWVAMTLLDQVDRGTIGLYDSITVLPSDQTLFHQPIVTLVGTTGYRTTVLDLLLRAMTKSDNTANDRLLTLVGGPQAVKAFLAAKGIDGVDFGPGERLLQSQTAGLAWDQRLSTPGAFQSARSRLPAQTRQIAYRNYVAAPPDGATACGIATALSSLHRGRLLSDASTQTLISIMSSSTTGRARLKAGLAPGWMLAHKTGTGQSYAGRTAGFNDVGILTAPDGAAYVVAVLIGDSASSERTRQHFIAAISRSVVSQHARTNAGF